MNEPGPQPSRRVLPITSVVTFLGFLDSTLLIPVMALYAAGLGARVGIIGFIIGLYSLTNTLANILFGRLIDRVGYKVPLIAGLMGDALAMFLYSLSKLPMHLALVRALHGISGGLVGPATMSVFANLGGAARGRVMSLYGVSLAAATLIGFGASGVIVSRLGYKALFLFGAILLTIGVVLSLLLPGDKLKSSATAPTSYVGGRQQVTDLLRRRGLYVSYCSIFAQYFTFGGVVTLLPIYVNRLGMEAFHVGILLATFAIVFLICQFPSGRLSDKVGRLIPTLAGLSLGIVSLLILPWLATLPLLAAGMALYGLGYGLLFPSISALLADTTVPEERGLATGVFHALLTAGVAVGAPIMGWVGEMAGVELGLVFTSAIMVLALAVAVTALKRS